MSSEPVDPQQQRTKLKPLECPKCGHGYNPTYHKRQPVNAHPDKVTIRLYRCSNPVCGEVYTTREVPEGSALHDVVVVRGGGSEHASYSRGRLEEDLGQYIPKGLTDGERSIILDYIERRVEDHVAHVRKISDTAPAVVEIRTGELVELALQGIYDATLRAWHGHTDGQDRVRVAHAMYALATLGSVRSRWRSVHDFIDWMDEQYPHLRQVAAFPQTEGKRPATIKWALPQQTRPMSIQSVVTNRRFSPSGDSPTRRARLDFDEEKMRKKIARAFRGRERNGNRTEQVTEWVLWGLVGQRVVRTSQLSASIAEALRGIDGIAYLRWVAIGKELDLVQLYEEALNLLSNPSPALSIDTRQRTRIPMRPGAVAGPEESQGRPGSQR